MMHTAIVLGWAGEMNIYIDVPEDECITRFMSEVGYNYDVVRKSMKKFNFTDEFRVYDAWGLSNVN